MPTKTEAITSQDVVTGGIESARAASTPVREVRNPLLERVIWKKSADPRQPYFASHGNEVWKVRLNDFPNESLFTLIVDGAEVGDFDAWPEAWKRP
jgi:hypothetical protein